ncbi:MAG: lytic transglycosylase domain-containing protein [Gammaproteobacteria bacterium]
MVHSKNNLRVLPKFSIWPISLFFCLFTLSMNGYAEYFVYKHEDGTTWYSDKNLPAQNYKLIATIGRPTASVSCTGSISNRAKDHAPIIQQYSDLYGVNEQLIKAIITVESCFDRYAVSRVGAKGLMQLMPQTAKLMGVHNVFNAKDNIRGGTRYFRQMLELFEFDIELALAAYNAGPGAVKKYSGIPPYKETQGYVKKVLKHYNTFAEVDS